MRVVLIIKLKVFTLDKDKCYKEFDTVGNKICIVQKFFSYREINIYRTISFEFLHLLIKNIYKFGLALRNYIILYLYVILKVLLFFSPIFPLPLSPICNTLTYGVEWCNFEEDTNVLFIKKKFLITFQYGLFLASNMNNVNILNIS